ncbi:MAG: NAD-dependent epimerase/dehydratase family protein [Chloroflexi bacterium]|nr:NAD-dependent epimerase/dehydratase family protein [Chloroflexota bacterium]
MIFVTGGTGFLGRYLIAELCRRGYRLRVLTRHAADHPWLADLPGVEVVEGDLADRDRLMQVVPGCRTVIHAGGKFRFWGDEAAFMRTNAEGTRNIVEAALGAGVERFLHVSTIAVIGHPDPDQIIDETFPPQPADAYQRSKWEGEQIVLDACRTRGLPAMILRPGAFYGPLGEYGFNRLFFRDPLRGILMQINGGRYIIFPAYIADVATGIALALERGRIGETYHLCGDWISHREAFDIVCAEAGIWAPRLKIPGWLGISFSRLLEGFARVTGREPFYPLNLKSYVYNYWRVSNEKARRELGFAPTDFREGRAGRSAGTAPGGRRTVQRWFEPVGRRPQLQQATHLAAQLRVFFDRGQEWFRKTSTPKAAIRKRPNSPPTNGTPCADTSSAAKSACRPCTVSPSGSSAGRACCFCCRSFSRMGYCRSSARSSTILQPFPAVPE